jgi:NADH:ubiquinone oxidoreductase subunit F (NADH-binding)
MRARAPPKVHVRMPREVAELGQLGLENCAHLRVLVAQSCGQCTPCRVGTEKAVKLMRRKIWDEALLGNLAKVMGDASICGLGQAAMHSGKQVLKHFPEDFAPKA